MRTTLATLFVLLFAFVLPALAGEQGDVTLYFSPRGGCEAAIVKAVDNSEIDILVAAYSFSSKPIAKALYRATKRGVFVRVLLDKRQPTAHYSMANDLQQGGLAIRVDKGESMMHMKAMIIDGKLVILGSYNFTASAEARNAEILCFIISPEIAAQATKNWYRHWKHSTPHKAKMKATQTENPWADDSACSNETCPIVPSTTTTFFLSRRPKRWSSSSVRCSRWKPAEPSVTP